jgi:hypothetical protein
MRNLVRTDTRQDGPRELSHQTTPIPRAYHAPTPQTIRSNTPSKPTHHQTPSQPFRTRRPLLPTSLRTKHPEPGPRPRLRRPPSQTEEAICSTQTNPSRKHPTNSAKGRARAGSDLHDASQPREAQRTAVASLNRRKRRSDSVSLRRGACTGCRLGAGREQTR